MLHMGTFRHFSSRSTDAVDPFQLPSVSVVVTSSTLENQVCVSFRDMDHRSIWYTVRGQV